MSHCRRRISRYRILLQVNDKEARDWYEREAGENILETAKKELHNNFIVSGTNGFMDELDGFSGDLINAVKLILSR